MTKNVFGLSRKYRKIINHKVIQNIHLLNRIFVAELEYQTELLFHLDKAILANHPIELNVLKHIPLLAPSFRTQSHQYFELSHMLDDNMYHMRRLQYHRILPQVFDHNDLADLKFLYHLHR
jgi:hypothetical protein